ISVQEGAIVTMLWT
nr:immunoglobulin heavy chain junction region [Mus musculus]